MRENCEDIMSEIFPKKDLSSKELQAYQQDYTKGSQLIKNAEQDYIKSTLPEQKEQLKKSMSEALNAMNEIINNVLHSKGEKYENKLNEDYNNFITNANEKTMKKLNKDLDKTERKIS